MTRKQSQGRDKNNGAGRDLFSAVATHEQPPSAVVQIEPISIDALTDSVIRSNFEPAVIGEAMLRIGHEENAIELALGFSAIVVKARRARMRKGT